MHQSTPQLQTSTPSSGQTSTQSNKQKINTNNKQDKNKKVELNKCDEKITLETKKQEIDGIIDFDIDETIITDGTSSNNGDDYKFNKQLKHKNYNEPTSISILITDIFEQNKLNDLTRFMKKRQCLNEANIVLIYLFHIIQAGGIIITTIAGGYNIKELIWVGISLNLIASLINIFEQTNNNLSIKLYKNIKDIKDNNYIDESILVEDHRQLDENKMQGPAVNSANKSFYGSIGRPIQQGATQLNKQMPMPGQSQSQMPMQIMNNPILQNIAKSMPLPAAFK